MFAIRFAEGAAAELKRVRAFDRARLVDHIASQLSEYPMVATAKRKLLGGVVSPWEAVRPVWQLRVGEYRVFYDVDEELSTVVVQAVKRQPHGKTTKEIL